MRFLSTATAVLAVSFATQTAFAQTLTPTERAATIRAALSRAPDPTDGPAVSAAGPKVILEATTKDKIATARIAQVWNNLRVEALFRGKVGEGSDTTELADLDGIRNKTSFKGSVMYTRWGIGNPAAILLGPCTNYRNQVEAKRRREITQRTRGGIRAKLEEAFPPPERTKADFEQRWKAMEADLESKLPEAVEAEMKKGAPIVCTLLMLRNAAKEAAANAEPGSSEGENARREITELGKLLDPGTLLFFGGDVSFSPEEFKFVTLTNAITNGKEDHTSRSFSARASILTKQNVTYTLSVGYEKAWKANGETELCRPERPEGVLICGPAVVNGPQMKEKTKGTLGLRWFPNPRFALDARVNHDFKNSETGVEFPMYFLQSPEGGLAGGVNVGYHVDKKEFTAVLFVGGLSTLIPR